MYIITPQTAAKDMNILIYGNQGVGKTVLAATAQDHPDMANVLFANVEGGLISVASRGDIRAVDITAIDKPAFAGTSDDDRGEYETSLEELFWALANNDERYEGVKTVVIDSVTELQTLNLEEIVKAEHKKRPRDSRDDIWQQDYGKSTAQLKRMFRWYRDLPRNVIWTALPKFAFPPGNNPNAEPLAAMPSLTTKLGDSLMGYVDFVWYMFLREDDEGTTHRCLLTQSAGIYRAKTRGMRFAEDLGLTVVDPNLGDLYNRFLHAEEPKTKESKKK